MVPAALRTLPAENANGQPYEYTIREIINGRPHGDGDVFAYGETHTAVSVAGSQQEGYVVTNTLWRRDWSPCPCDQDVGPRPGMSGYPVAFELYRHVQGEDASGAVRVENPVCDYGGPYQVEFRDLPKYDGAAEAMSIPSARSSEGRATRTATCLPRPGGGTTAVSIAPAESGGYVVRNVVRRDGELLSIPVRKVWRGGTGAGVTVQLYRGTEGDEKMEGRVLLLGEHNGWEGVFENLRRHDAAGRACTYTVREVVEGVSYGDGDRFVAGGALIRLSIEGDETSGFTVINTMESTKGPPVTGVTSPAALAGAGLLASVAGHGAPRGLLSGGAEGERKNRGIDSGREPGQTVPAPTVSPFWGRAAALGAAWRPRGAPANEKAVAARTKKGKPQGVSALERSGSGFIRGPVSCGLSRGFVRQPIPRGTGCPLPAGGPASLPCAAGLEALRSRGRACIAGSLKGGEGKHRPHGLLRRAHANVEAARIRRMGSGEHGLHLMLRRRGVRGDEAAFDGLSVHGQGQAALLIAREVANVDAVEAAPEATVTVTSLSCAGRQGCDAAGRHSPA